MQKNQLLTKRHVELEDDFSVIEMTIKRTRCNMDIRLVHTCHEIGYFLWFQQGGKNFAVMKAKDLWCLTSDSVPAMPQMMVTQNLILFAC